MAVAADTYLEKTDEQKAITEMVRQFADNEIIPVAEEYDHEDKFPDPIVEQMKELGLFGVTIPEEHGGMGLDLTTYAMIVEELSRGWISISGVVNTHFIGSYLLMKFGTDEQKEYFLPKMATGEIRAAFSLSEPEVGSDVQGIKSTAKQVDGEWEISGQKMWVTNGLLSGVVFVLVKTDPKADPPYKGMTCFICEKEPGVDEMPGLRIPPKIKKMGYKGVESTELVFDGFKVPEERVLGGPDGIGQGFVQMMDALEVGRVNVAARGVGVAQRAMELALRYSQERKAFGKPIAQHQAITFKLAEMGTRLEAARLLTLKAARMKDAGERSDLEAGMAKLFASEAAKANAEEALRIHGGYGYSKEYEIERIYRDAPLLLIGEGTSEIQKMVIGKKLLERNRV
ncbi:MAG TPA: acyl-CoA dehydrogenase family protein [Solirubrobacterales bacterium]|nr:acyl-CoA dehydrogenase family protein [Solirubrobacterales bacterium]